MTVEVNRFVYAALLLFWAENLTRWGGDIAATMPHGLSFALLKVIAILALILVILIMALWHFLVASVEVIRWARDWRRGLR